MRKIRKCLIWAVILAVYFILVSVLGVCLVFLLRVFAHLEDPTTFTIYGCFMTTAGFAMGQFVEDFGKTINQRIDRIGRNVD